MQRFLPFGLIVILSAATAAPAAAAPRAGHAPAAPHTARPGGSGNDRVFSWSFTTSQGRLGAQVQDMTGELRQFFGAGADAGVLVAHVEPGTPAALAGVRVGDVIVAVGGSPIASGTEVWSALAGKNKGDVVDLTVVRDKHQLTLRATLADDGVAWDGNGNIDLALPDFDLDLPDVHVKPFSQAAPLGPDPRLREQMRQLEERMRRLEDRLEQLDRT